MCLMLIKAIKATIGASVWKPFKNVWRWSAISLKKKKLDDYELVLNTTH